MPRNAYAAITITPFAAEDHMPVFVFCVSRVFFFFREGTVYDAAYDATDRRRHELRRER